VELLQLLGEIISSHVVLLELKISIPLSHTDGLGIMAIIRFKSERAPAFYPSFHYDWLMLLVKLQSVQAIAIARDVTAMNSSSDVIIQCEFMILLLLL
jgi:hypothetical protein